MQGGVDEFLRALALVLCVAAVTTVLFQKLHQPVVLGYLIAGLIIGPHVPVPLVADGHIVHTLAELGVILLMFSLGLEFSLRKLIQVAPTAGVTAVIQCSLMVWLGFVVGRAFGWTVFESIFTGAIIAISSTTIIAKVFDEQKIRGRLREIVVGVLIVEDLIAILMMAALTAISTGAGLSAGLLAVTVGRLLAFLVGLITIGLFIVPRLMRAILKLERKETTLVASIGICFASALLAHKLGYSVALGAFMAGTLLAESGRVKEIEELVEPVRDVFAAVFFVSVGMLMDPALIAKHWVAVVVLTLVVIVGKIVGVAAGAFLTGSSTHTSLQAGMSLAQIGEFSFIIAALGTSLKVTGSFLYPVAVAVSAITTLSTPWLIRASGPVASFVDRKLPPRLQTVVSLYGSWLEALRNSGRARTAGSAVWRMVLLLLIDAALLVGIIIGTSLFSARLAAEAHERVGIDVGLAKILILGVAAGLAFPFCFGMVQVGRRAGATLAEMALPRPVGATTDLAMAPRKVLTLVFQLATALLLGVPLVAITQPFLPGFPAAVLVVIGAAMLAIAFWRSASNLEGHVRAGAQVVMEALRQQARSHTSGDALQKARQLLPGMGEPVSVTLDAQSPALGRTLAELNLRGMTGATVLAISRNAEELVIPQADEVLKEGDVLALVGSREAISASKTLLGCA